MNKKIHIALRYLGSQSESNLILGLVISGIGLVEVLHAQTFYGFKVGIFLLMLSRLGDYINEKENAIHDNHEQKEDKE